MATKKNNSKIMVVRSAQAGVFYGEVDKIRESVAGVSVQLKTARRIWYWSGAASLSQLATEGVKNPGTCKFSVPTQDHIVFGVCELIPVTATALAVLDGVPNWKA